MGNEHNQGKEMKNQRGDYLFTVNISPVGAGLCSFLDFYHLIADESFSNV